MQLSSGISKSMILVISVLSVIAATTSSFSIHHSNSDTSNRGGSFVHAASNVNQGNNQVGHKNTSSSSSSSLCASVEWKAETHDGKSLKTRRASFLETAAEARIGKFQSDVYNKPLVLIGRSSETGNELIRLATSYVMMSDQSSSSSSTSPSTSTSHNVPVLESLPKEQHVAALPPASVLSLSNADASDVSRLMTLIENGSLDKSNVIVLDFEPSTKINQDQLVTLSKALFEHDLLSIYINVEQPQGKDNDDKKSLLEQDVFLPNTDYELCIKGEASSSADPDAWKMMEWQFRRLIGRAFLPLAIPGSDTPSLNTASLTMGQNAFFLSLSFPDIQQVSPYVEAMCEDVDAMEFRADLLSCRYDRFELLYQLQTLREMCRPHASRAPMLPVLGNVLDDALPVVFTVRTAHQAGTFPDDDEGIADMYNILHLGLRAGVEVLDVESAWDEEKRNSLLNLVEDRYATQILGSHHVVGEQVSDVEAAKLYRKCALEGRAHGAKVVLSIEDDSKDNQADLTSEMAKSMAKEAGDPVIPHIGLVLGEIGKYSRVLNGAFTPVTHESLPFAAAPGQLSASEIMTTRIIMGVLQTKKYGILGHNIAYSVSPAMQGAAFASTGLPHSYDLIDMESVDEFVTSDLWNDPSFGGCSVTIPHKQAIIPHLDILTDAAKSIGAVNTVIVEEDEDGEDRILVGDNTDWKGIFNPLNRKLGRSVSDGNKIEVALILGGGGTARAAAYAATQLGLERIYYNRTPSKAHDLADTFGGTVASNLDDFNNDSESSLGTILQSMNGEVRVVISTLPAAAEFELPNWLVDLANDVGRRPIVFDVNYKPYWTKLLEQADNEKFPNVRGSEMLWEQGVGQFELWTGRTAPYNIMKSVVLQNCLPQNE